jgi:hypothetical protein
MAKDGRDAPFLARVARNVEGEVSGRTLITHVRGETHGDAYPDEYDVGVGQKEPFLLARSTAAAGVVEGRTLITRMPETTDDAGTLRGHLQ